MYFKISVFLCAVYFFTSVLSGGLNEDQIKKCIELFEVPRNSFEAEIMKQFFESEKAKKSFDYNWDGADYINLKNLFLALAYEDNKIGDSFEVVFLTSFEVEFFVDVFVRQADHFQQEGYLTREQLSNLFKPDHLKLTDNQMKKAENLMNDLNINNSDDDRFNLAEFLLIALEIKPEGNGLYETRIKKLYTLYEYYKTESGCINRSEIQKMFIKFDMASTAHQNSMLFKFQSNRHAHRELMELMIVTAERSKTVYENEMVLSTYEVRSVLSEFINLDKDKNGTISQNEQPELYLDDYRNFRKNIFRIHNFADTNEVDAVNFLMYHVIKKKNT